MDTAISAIVIIVVICSLISGFTKKKPPQGQGQQGQSPASPANSPRPNARTAYARPGQAGTKAASGEGMSFSGEGKAQAQGQMVFGEASSEGKSSYPVRKPVMLEEEEEPFIAMQDFLEHESLVKGIIISEVLGRPKSMR